jgi:hypothetical protein
MSSEAYPFPVALSRLGNGDSRETQNSRAIRWVLQQDAGPIVLVTPRRDFSGQSLRALAARADVTHLTWRGFSPTALTGRRAVHAWPAREHLNDLWGVRATALVVIEWNESHSTEWIEDAAPDLLLPSGTQRAPAVAVDLPADLPDDVVSILTSTARWAAGYSEGLKWNEEDKLKADMMSRPARWAEVTVDQVRAKCRELGMQPKDVDTIAGLVQRRKDGRRFNVRSSYRDFHYGG